MDGFDRRLACPFRVPSWSTQTASTLTHGRLWQYEISDYMGVSQNISKLGIPISETDPFWVLTHHFARFDSGTFIGLGKSLFFHHCQWDLVVCKGGSVGWSLTFVMGRGTVEGSRGRKEGRKGKQGKKGIAKGNKETLECHFLWQVQYSALSSPSCSDEYLHEQKNMQRFANTKTKQRLLRTWTRYRSGNFGQFLQINFWSNLPKTNAFNLSFQWFAFCRSVKSTFFWLTSALALHSTNSKLYNSKQASIWAILTGNKQSKFWPHYSSQTIFLFDLWVDQLHIANFASDFCSLS